MKIRIIKEENDFLSLKTDWDKLAANLVCVNSFDWLYAWWKNFKDRNELHILVAEDNDKIIGIAPLYIQKTRALKFIPLKKLCFLGGDLSDYQDFLIEESNDKEEVFKAFFDYITGNTSYDLLDLCHINSDYPNFELWKKYSGLNYSKFEVYRENHKSDLSKFQSYEDYYSKLDKKLRSNINRRQNRIKKSGINVEYVIKKDITKEDIATIAEINIKRQRFLYKKGNRKRFCYYLDKKKNNFIREYFCSDKNSSKAIAYIKLNNIPAGYNLIVLSKSTFSLWNCAFDNEFEDYCPSKLLFCELIKYAFENNYRYFDFMRGNDPYKLKWTNHMALNYSFEFPKTLKARLVNFYRENAPNFILQKLRKKVELFGCEELQA